MSEPLRPVQSRFTADDTLAADLSVVLLPAQLVLDAPRAQRDDTGEGYWSVVTAAVGRVVGYRDVNGDLAVETDDSVYTGPEAGELALAILAVHTAAAGEPNVDGGEFRE